MYTYLYCLLAATLAARKRHDLLALSLEEALRWMIIRGYSPFADWRERQILSDYLQIAEWVGRDATAHVSALQSLLLMENPAYDGLMQQGATLWGIKEVVSDSPCGAHLVMSRNSSILFRTATGAEALVVGDDVIPLGEEGGSILLGTAPSEGKLACLQVGTILFAQALLGGELLSAVTTLAKNDIWYQKMEGDGSVVVKRYSKGAGMISRKVYLK